MSAHARVQLVVGARSARRQRPRGRTWPSWSRTRSPAGEDGGVRGVHRQLRRLVRHIGGALDDDPRQLSGMPAGRSTFSRCESPCMSSTACRTLTAFGDDGLDGEGALRRDPTCRPACRSGRASVRSATSKMVSSQSRFAASRFVYSRTRWAGPRRFRVAGCRPRRGPREPGRRGRRRSRRRAAP